MLAQRFGIIDAIVVADIKIDLAAIPWEFRSKSAFL
jgi:hypothetical protein